MTRPGWMNSFLYCFYPEPLPPKDSTKSVPQFFKRNLSRDPTKQNSGAHVELLDLVPILWPYLSSSERLALRACSQESRCSHDMLVTHLCVCDNASVLSGVPANRLPRYPLPLCHATAHEIAKAQRGFTERGCQPHLLLLCLTQHQDRRRHEEGLAVLQALSGAASELAAVHLCGAPLTTQMARALHTLLAEAATTDVTAPATPRITTASLPLPTGPSASSSASIPLAALSIVSTPTPRMLLTGSPSPPAVPLRLNLYGYNLARQPAAAAVEMLVGSASRRLRHLELWGCVGWPKRLSTLLHACTHLHHFTMSFQQLLPSNEVATEVTIGTAEGFDQPPSSSGASIAREMGAVVAFPPLAAAATAAGVVKTIGGLHHLRSLELRGCMLNTARRVSCDSACRGRPASKAALERAAVAAAAPSVQQLAAALYQLTGLIRLAMDGLNSAAPLLSAVAAMRELRYLELPDAAACTAADMAAITRAAPRLVALTLGSVGPTSVLGAGGSSAAIAIAAAAAAPEVLPLPASLAALRVVRQRPTLRTMRSLLQTAEARASAPTSAAAAGTAAARMTVVVPGIEIDMMDMEFDALQGFSRGSDGVLHSTLLPGSVEALAAAIRLLAPPVPSMASQPPPAPSTVQGASASAALSSGAAPSSCSVSGAVSSTLGFVGAPSSSFPVITRGPSFASGVYGAAPSSSRGGGHTPGGGEGGGAVFGVGAGGGDWEFNWDTPAFGTAMTRELVIHNVQGSLGPPHHLPPAGPLEPPHDAATPMSSERAGGSGCGAAAAAADNVHAGGGDGAVGRHSRPLAASGHALWISEMRPLGLISLEFYGIGMRAGDLEAVAALSTLQRLTLASGELEVDALPRLATLPRLEHLELSRCIPCRHHRRAGSSGFAGISSGSGVARTSSGTAAAAAAAAAGAGGGGGGGGFASARVSYASSYDGDGDCGSEIRPSGRRALLELCMTAPRLRRLSVVRCMGVVSRAEGVEGPLGAEWVRQRLVATGPRAVDGHAVAAVATTSRDIKTLSKRSSLGRGSSAAAGSRAAAAPPPGAEVGLGWPEIVWQ